MVKYTEETLVLKTSLFSKVGRRTHGSGFDGRFIPPSAEVLAVPELLSQLVGVGLGWLSLGSRNTSVGDCMA